MAQAAKTLKEQVPSVDESQVRTPYLDALHLVERLHRRLLDVIKDEFERLGIE